MGQWSAEIKLNLLASFLFHQVDLLAAPDKHHPLPCISASAPSVPAAWNPSTSTGPHSSLASEPAPISLLYLICLQMHGCLKQNLAGYLWKTEDAFSGYFFPRNNECSRNLLYIIIEYSGLLPIVFSQDDQNVFSFKVILNSSRFMGENKSVVIFTCCHRIFLSTSYNLWRPRRSLAPVLTILHAVHRCFHGQDSDPCAQVSSVAA